MRTLKKLIGICEHEWKIIIENPVFPTWNGIKSSELPKSVDYIIQCIKCGKLKKFKA